MLAIFLKELTSFFKTPLGYLYLTVSLFVSGLLFMLFNLSMGNADFSPVLQVLQVLMIFTIPLLTMRLFSEEKRHHTDQLLLTSGVDIWKIVVAKIGAASVLFGCTVLGMLPCVLVIELYGSVDWLHILNAFLGYVLLGEVYICIGTFLSCITENQMMAAVGGFVVLFLLWLLQVLADSVPKTTSMGWAAGALLCMVLLGFVHKQTKSRIFTFVVFALYAIAFALCALSNKEFITTWFSNSLNWLAISKRYHGFLMGVIKWGDIVYFVGLGCLFAYFSVWKLEKRRWSED